MTYLLNRIQFVQINSIFFPILGDIPEELDSPFKKINGSTSCLSTTSVKENGVMTMASSTPKNHLTNGSLGNIK